MSTIPELLKNTIIDDFLLWSAFLGGIYTFLRRQLLPHLLQIQQFIQDFYGTEDRPGVEGRPGIMSRLADQDKILESIRDNLMPNGGGSSYDRIIEGQEEITARVGRIRGDLEDLTKNFTVFAKTSIADRSLLHTEQEALKELLGADPCIACPLRKDEDDE